MKSGSTSHSGIYVEIFILQTLERVWQLTQQPELHERWDLRFSQIRYLPRPSLAEPQRFIYETRLGFGLTIKGTGESVGQCSKNGDTTSSLKFVSEDPKSLIRQGSGYWRYVPTNDGLRFFTWYDYQVRFGALGRLIDRFIFRPLIGWATAWSFDCLRLWAEKDQSPETSLNLCVIHGVVRIALSFIWIWHGLVPKLLYQNLDERAMLSQAGVSLQWLPGIGSLEILFGVIVLLAWNRREVLVANGILMIAATIAVAINSPSYLTAAFNPVTLNLAVAALCVVGWLASGSLPSAGRCLRKEPKGQV